MTHLLYSFLTVIIALFFLILGFFAFFLPWVESLQVIVINFIRFDAWPWNLFGLGLIIAGLALLGHVWYASKRTYLTLKTGIYETTIHQSVLDDYFRSYWQKLFPKQEIPYHFALKRRKILIHADLPFFPKEEQGALANRIKEEISGILRDFLGYPYQMEISLSFEKSPPLKKQ